MELGLGSHLGLGARREEVCVEYVEQLRHLGLGVGVGVGVGLWLGLWLGLELGLELG